MKSIGPCEICEKVRPCNDIHHDMVDLGPVQLYHFKQKVFLKPNKKSFEAPAGKFRIVGFDMKKLFGGDKEIYIPVNYLEDFTKKKDAVIQILSLREKIKSDSEQQYFLYNDKGYMKKISNNM